MDSQGLITGVFAFLDRKGSEFAVAEAELQLANDEYMTVQCGGSGSRSRPAAGLYEVLIDHDPPRFWTRYSEEGGLVFANVPQLLIRHHITRRGGIVHWCRQVTQQPHLVEMDLHIEVELGLEMQVMEALRAQGANVTKTHLTRV